MAPYPLHPGKHGGMAAFKKTHTRGYSRAAAKTTSDTLYWKKLDVRTYGCAVL